MMEQHNKSNSSLRDMWYVFKTTFIEVFLELLEEIIAS